MSWLASLMKKPASSGIVLLAAFSEGDLQRELNIFRLAGSYARVVKEDADRRADLATFAGRWQSHGSQIGVVEKIEEVGPELRVDPLGRGL